MTKAFNITIDGSDIALKIGGDDISMQDILNAAAILVGKVMKLNEGDELQVMSILLQTIHSQKKMMKDIKTNNSALA